MKVAPVDRKAKTEEEMKNGSKTGQYLFSAIHMFMYCLGLSPYKFNKETGEVSFKWFSCETIWSLVRLVVFNSPFSFLPVVLFAIYGTDEWSNQANMAEVNNMNVTLNATSNATSTGTLNATLNAMSNATLNAALNVTRNATSYDSAPNGLVYKIIVAIEFISSFSFFILHTIAKSILKGRHKKKVFFRT